MISGDFNSTGGTALGSFGAPCARMPSFNQKQRTMQLDDHCAFTTTLTATLARDPRVAGLIALGSMAEQD